MAATADRVGPGDDVVTGSGDAGRLRYARAPESPPQDDLITPLYRLSIRGMATAAARETAARETAPPGPRPVLRLLGAETAAELAGKVASARELGRGLAERRRGVLPTGLAALDRLLAGSRSEAAGGLPRGKLVELVGRPGSGRFTAALTALATATAAGEAAALVDLGDHLDPASIAALGADLARLLWLRPRDVGEALAAAEAVLAGGLPLVVVDLGAPPVAGGRGPEAGWLRLARAAEAHGAALLVSAPYRVSGTAAHAVVAAARAAPAYAPSAAAAPGAPPSPPLVAGIGLHLRLDKHRGRREGREARQTLALPEALPLFPPSAEGEAPAAARPRTVSDHGKSPATGRRPHAEAAPRSIHGRSGRRSTEVPSRSRHPGPVIPSHRSLASPLAAGGVAG